MTEPDVLFGGWKKDEADAEEDLPNRGGCTRTDWDHPCTNVEHCGRSRECTDKYKTGFFSKKHLVKFRKKK